MITYDEAKSAATRIVERLRALGVDTKNSHGYQAVAAYHDFPDWNRFNAAIDKAARAPSARSGNAPATAARRDGRTKKARYDVLLDVPGSGKTTMLWMRAVIESLERGSTFLFITLDGEDYIPAQLAAATHRISVSVPADGEPSQKPTTSLVQASASKAAGAMVSLRLPREVSSFNARPTYLRTLRELPEILAATLPAEFLESVSLICLDEAHRVMNEGERELYSDIIPRWRLGNANILVATQAISRLSSLTSARPGQRMPHVITSSRRMAESLGPSPEKADSGRVHPSIIGQFATLLEHADPVELFTSDILLVELIFDIIHRAIEHKEFPNWAETTLRAKLFRDVLNDAAAKEAERRERIQQWVDAEEAETSRSAHDSSGINKGFKLES